MAPLRVEWLVREGGANAPLSLVLVGLAALAGVVALFEGHFVRAGGAFLLVAVAGVPSLAARSWRTAFAWPLVLVVTLPAHFVAYGPGFLADVAASVALATFALAVVVDLHLLTRVRMSTGFTAAFVVIATVGFAGFWTVIAWLLSLYAGTAFVASNTALMVDLLLATGAGVVLGVGFEWFARRHLHRTRAARGGVPS